MQIFWGNSWDYQLYNRELNALWASCSYLPCCLKRCCSIHGFITYLCILWSGFYFHFLPVPFALRGYLHFCYICHQSTLTSGCTLIHSAFLKLLSLCFTWEKWPPSFLSSHFLTFISLHCSPRIPDSILWKWYLGLSDTGICFFKKILFVFQMITLQVLNLSSLEQSILKSSWLFTLRFYPGSFN